MSGNHKKIEEWRYEEALKRTEQKRPDLLKNQ
jgi:tRNA (guanine37-N1)-methyltransferase